LIDLGWKSPILRSLLRITLTQRLLNHVGIHYARIYAPHAAAQTTTVKIGVAALLRRILDGTLVQPVL
jgi:hypothetical protein